jgi:hypothetical protein
MELEVILTSYYLKAQNPQYVVLLEDWRRVVLNMDMSIAPSLFVLKQIGLTKQASTPQRLTLFYTIPQRLCLKC